MPAPLAFEAKKRDSALAQAMLIMSRITTSPTFLPRQGCTENSTNTALAFRPPLSIGIHPDRRRRRANPPQRNRRSVGLESELIVLAASIRSRARDRGNLAAGDISDLAAYAVG